MPANSRRDLIQRLMG